MEMQEDTKSRLHTEIQESKSKFQQLIWFMGRNQFHELDREAQDMLYSQQRTLSKYIQGLEKWAEKFGGPYTVTEEEKS